MECERYGVTNLRNVSVGWNNAFRKIPYLMFSKSLILTALYLQIIVPYLTSTASQKFLSDSF